MKDKAKTPEEIQERKDGLDEIAAEDSEENPDETEHEFVWWMKKNQNPPGKESRNNYKNEFVKAKEEIKQIDPEEMSSEDIALKLKSLASSNLAAFKKYVEFKIDETEGSVEDTWRAVRTRL